MDHHRARSRAPQRAALPAAVLGLLLAFLLAGCGGTGGSTVAGARVDPFTATELRGGKAVTTATLTGKPVLLASWSTACATCAEGLAGLEALWQSRGKDGLQVIAVNVDADGAAARTLPDTVAAMGLTMPEWRDPDNRFTAHYAGLGVPMLVLLDRAGRVHRTWQRTLDVSAPEIADALAEAMGG